MKITIAASQYIPWREQLNINEVETLNDEFGWDALFEEIENCIDIDGGSTSVKRVSTPIPNFHRNDTAVKTASASSASNWDAEFANAQAHAKELLSKLGY